MQLTLAQMKVQLRTCYLLLTLFGLWSLTSAQPLSIAARGAFYRPITTATTIANGASLPFTVTVAETNTAFFTLEASGDVKIIKTDKYLIMAEAPFNGDAQMQFQWNGAGDCRCRGRKAQIGLGCRGCQKAKEEDENRIGGAQG